MHCLPADISGVSCQQGEVSDYIFEKYRNKTYLEAGFKPYTIAAMMLVQKFERPGIVLEKILESAHKRVLY
jgi:ornithine carbamoyltransferase